MDEPIVKFPNGDFTTLSYLKNHYYKTGHFGKPKGIRINDYMIIDDKVHQIHKVIVHRFRMGDVEDPDLYAAEPLYNWQKSPQGEWVMENSVEPPVWHRMADLANYGHKYVITATFVEKKLTEYYLRFGNLVERIT